ncbi:MAG: hypothetical protein ABI175_01250 [Polyangiales bacterium]
MEEFVMSQKMLAALLLSLPITACAVQSTPDDQNGGVNDEGVSTIGQAQSKTRPGTGQACHSESGVVNGTMTEDGWCCGKRLCDDIAICGFENYGKYEDSCANCSPGADTCHPGSRLRLPTVGDGTQITTGGVLVSDPPPATGTGGTNAGTASTVRR